MTTTPPIIKQNYRFRISAAGRPRRSWQALAGTLVFACWAALLLPAGVYAAPPEPSPEPTAPAAEAPKAKSTCAPVVVTFARGSGWPDRTMEPRLRALGAWAAAHPEVSLVVDGHADTSGSEETNLKLSRERAYAVRSILEKEKVPRARVTTRSFGSFWPADEAPPDASWNRRVVVVTKGETCPPEEITRP